MSDAESDTSRILIVGFRSGEAIDRHPALLPLLQRGWKIKRSEPRIVEQKGLRLLVVLERPDDTPAHGQPSLPTPPPSS